MAAYDPFEDTNEIVQRVQRTLLATAKDRDPDKDAGPKRKRARAGHFDEAPPEDADEDERTESASSLQPRSRIEPGKDVSKLIGVVRPLSNPRKQDLCTHFLANDCLWGDKCRFSHSAEELRVGTPATEGMNFFNLEAGLVARTMDIPKAMLRCFMTESTRRLLTEACGVSEVDWEPETSKVTIAGTAAQVESAQQLLRRAITHCNWGISEAKVQGLLSQQPRRTAKLRLAPMVPTLKQAEFNLSEARQFVTIGADSSCDLSPKGALISRAHARLEFMPDKGTLYVVDMSTNGTFLNGVRLPTKQSGKVAMFHGDELLFPEPNKTVNMMEFGYMVNLEIT